MKLHSLRFASRDLLSKMRGEITYDCFVADQMDSLTKSRYKFRMDLQLNFTIWTHWRVHSQPNAKCYAFGIWTTTKETHAFFDVCFSFVENFSIFWHFLCVINMIAHLKYLKWLGVYVQFETGVVNHEQNDLRFKLFQCFFFFSVRRSHNNYSVLTNLVFETVLALNWLCSFFLSILFCFSIFLSELVVDLQILFYLLFMSLLFHLLWCTIGAFLRKATCFYFFFRYFRWMQTLFNVTAINLEWIIQ